MLNTSSYTDYFKSLHFCESRNFWELPYS